MHKALTLAAAIALAVSGCDVLELADEPCPPTGTTITYANFGKAFFAENCNWCHSQEVGDRRGAPEGYAFDTLEEIRNHKERIFARAAGPNDSMPPGPDDPPRENRDKLAEWLACGAP
jgi:uncharacterized membrane protein